ncbi:MAG TPA: molybdopterin cofactor-binding domain-containing protein [Xanthobacteraceae bacterium]|nr:molybdopterin cofactor-binding domain-containing protein [Xanthobacteraceae bacterium]
MNQMAPSLTRREWLLATGALIVTAAGPLAILGDAAAQSVGAGFGDSKPPLKPTELDSWIAIGRDGKVTAYFGKTDAGQGTDIAVQQIVAEELDVPFERVTVLMGDTSVTVNLGGASNSTGVKVGAQQLRSAAAEARRLLLEAAAQKWGGLASDQLTVENGIIKAAGDGTRQISYADLIGGKYFHQQVEWNNKIGNALEIKVRAEPKKVADYKIVGKSFPRADVTGKVCGTVDYVTDVKLPGMLHARVIRPPVAGATPVSVDEASIKAMGASVVRVKDLVAVVAEKEWDAVRGAQALKVTWSAANPPFPGHQDMYDFIRAARPAEGKMVKTLDGVDAIFAGAPKTIQAEYEWPLQSHASMGPACALAEVKGDSVTVYTGSAKPHYAAQGIARTLGLKPENVRAIWVRGPGVYGRNDADDAAATAAVLAKAVGRPVRFQGMREDGTGWDPKAPAGVHSVRAAFDKDGNVLAYEFFAKGFSSVDVNSNGSKPQDLLVAQLMGTTNADRKYNFNVPGDSYKFPKHTGWSAIAPMLELGSPLRTSHMRDTTGVQLHFSGESFADEMAYAAGMDPLAFRLKYISKPREKAAVQAAAEKANWQPRTAPRKLKAANGNYVGQGIAYAHRSGTIVAIVAEVEVNPATGRIWPRKYTVAHDCGIVINPAELTRVLEAGVVQASSRALFEEVLFDRKNVRSVDWQTYPILEMQDAPAAIEVVLIDHPDQVPGGAGEAVCRPVAGAIANALFDATGVRLRRAPLTAARVKAALG